MSIIWIPLGVIHEIYSNKGTAFSVSIRRIVVCRNEMSRIISQRRSGGGLFALFDRTCRS